ncbi:NADPH:quinone oxidoreductase family protein [Nocardia bovistercoris]|uniref:NADPH:quinone oxidoreductase family protein n=1 Tax=Nocardia bovistercoris TaxID=2785916 RepID=A0A931IB99_9NOCA|nr:NADPH:quinone oxidoreductase family protein [Nocardia bovistercoris]
MAGIDSAHRAEELGADRTTRAAVCVELTGEDGIEIADWPVPPVGDRDIRISVRAASVNFPDCLMVRGQYHFRPDLPFVPGSESAGIVTEIGAAVTGFRGGDRVLALNGFGAFASDVVVSNAMPVYRIPEAMSFDEGSAFLMTYGTSYHGLVRRGGLRAGESVLVLGATGGCGSAAVQIAKAAGATVVAVAGGEAKCAAARELGADVVIDHRTTSSLSESVRDATGGRGVDLVFDPVGGEDIREPLRCLAWDGRYLVIGFAGGGIPVVRLNQTILKSISLIGVAFGASVIKDPEAGAADFAQLSRWYEEGSVRPLVGARFPLERTADAMRVVHERRAIGKVVVTVENSRSR